MNIETNSPKIAAMHIVSRIKTGKGATVTLPNKAVLFFADSTYFGAEVSGLFISCTKGGCVVFQHPSHINRFACIKARMPSWAAKFVVEVAKELLQQSRLTVRDNHANSTGRLPEIEDKR